MVWSKVTSKKLMVFLLVSAVIFSPCLLNIMHRYCLLHSASQGVDLVTPKQSSLYSPRLILMLSINIMEKK